MPTFWLLLANNFTTSFIIMSTCYNPLTEVSKETRRKNVEPPLGNRNQFVPLDRGWFGEKYRFQICYDVRDGLIEWSCSACTT